LREVTRKKYENLDSLIRRFKKYNKDSIMELRARRYYKKPSQERHTADQDRKWLAKKIKQSLAKKVIEKNTAKRRGYTKKKPWQKKTTN